MARTTEIPTRAEVAPEDKWNLDKLFTSDEEWEKNGSLLGTMSYFPPIMGQMIASRVIRDLVGFA